MIALEWCSIDRWVGWLLAAVCSPDTRSSTGTEHRKYLQSSHSHHRPIDGAAVTATEMQMHFLASIGLVLAQHRDCAHRLYRLSWFSDGLPWTIRPAAAKSTHSTDALAFSGNAREKRNASGYYCFFFTVSACKCTKISTNISTKIFSRKYVKHITKKWKKKM